jgi:hypothetical protein
MSKLYQQDIEYLPNIPRYIQDIVAIHNYRYHLHDPDAQLAFDWYVDYVATNGAHFSYQQPQTVLLDTEEYND